jgi:hypothetical protein
MFKERSTGFKLLVRFLIALPLIIIGCGWLAAFLSPFFMLAAAILLAGPLAELCSEKIGEALLFSGGHSTEPKPIYSIPLARRQEGRYEEALTGLLDIAYGWPEQTQAWIEMLDLAVNCLNDGEGAEQIYQRGLATLQKEESRRQLTGMYAILKTRLKPATPPVRVPLPLLTNRPPPP